MTIRADHELLACLVETVERVEELLEDLFLALEELHIVEEEDVDLAVSVLELIHPFAADPVDELVEELLGGNIPNAGSVVDLHPVMTDRVEQVGLAQPGVGIDEQRVVMTARLLGKWYT